MLSKVITIDQVLSWDVCYDKETLLRLSRGKTEMTIGEIIDLRFVPAEEKLWLLLREEIIPARILHEFAIWCAEIALTRANITDERSWNALKVKRLWLDGKATDEELSAAEFAAWNAAVDAAESAAWDAIWSAAWPAAWYATWDAAWDVAWPAAWSAAASAAGSAAESAARDAAGDAAGDAAEAAAGSAAWKAAWSAARSAARDEQLAKLKEMLGA